MLNGKELHNEGVIVNHLEENLTQHGCDIRLRKVSVVKGQGFIPREGKTMLPSYEEVRCFPDINGNEVWHLPPGYYMIDFIEGCNIPKNKMGRIVQRSSVARCGAWIYSSIFDAGFHTDSMGTFMEVFHTITIEKNARVAQFYCYDCTDVNEEDLYNGQYQNDKQRK